MYSVPFCFLQTCVVLKPRQLSWSFFQALLLCCETIGIFSAILKHSGRRLLRSFYWVVERQDFCLPCVRVHECVHRSLCPRMYSCHEGQNGLWIVFPYCSPLYFFWDRSLTELYTQHVSHGSRTFLSLLSTLCYWHVRSCLAYKWVLEIQTQDLLSADANSHPHSLSKTVTLHLSTDIHLFPGSSCSWTLIAIILLSALWYRHLWIQHMSETTQCLYFCIWIIVVFSRSVNAVANYRK